MQVPGRNPDTVTYASRRTLSNVLLLASSFLNPYKVLRCVAALGAKVYVLGSEEARYLALSRHCTRLQPFAFDLTADLDGTASAIEEVARRYRIDLIVPSDPRTTRVLSSIHGLLSTPIFPVPDLVTFDDLATKDRFMLLCRRLGVPHPGGMLFSSRADFLDAVNNNRVRMPAMVKPVNRAGAIGVARIDHGNAQRIAASIDYTPILVQDFVEGEDRSISVLCDAGRITKQVIYSHVGGDFHFVEESALADTVAAIIKRLRFTGVINFDARIDRSGAVWMLECNPRFFFNVDVVMVAGLNFTRLDDVPSRIPNALAGCEIKIPQRVLRDIVRFQLPRENDRKLLIHWLRDPFLCFLLASGYRRCWDWRWAERMLTASKVDLWAPKIRLP